MEKIRNLIPFEQELFDQERKRLDMVIQALLKPPGSFFRLLREAHSPRREW